MKKPYCHNCKGKGYILGLEIPCSVCNPGGEWRARGYIDETDEQEENGDEFEKRMTDTEKLIICKRVYAMLHCQILDCTKKDCFECIEKRYLELTNIGKNFMDDEENGLID